MPALLSEESSVGWLARAFGIEQLAFAAAAPQKRIKQRRHRDPAQEIQIYVRENEDLQHARDERENPGSGGNVPH